jgi:hypothetical protein
LSTAEIGGGTGGGKETEREAEEEKWNNDDDTDGMSEYVKQSSHISATATNREGKTTVMESLWRVSYSV